MLAKLIIDTLIAMKEPVPIYKLQGLATINPEWDVRAELEQLRQQGKIAIHHQFWAGRDESVISLPGPHKLKRCEPQVGAVDAIRVTNETLRDGIDLPGLTHKPNCFILPGGTYAYKGDWIVRRNGGLAVFTSPAFLELWKQP